MRQAYWGVSFLIVLGFSQSGFAQPQVPGGGLQRPTVSPYINLLRGGNAGNAALNYFGIVRPELQFRQTAGMLQQQINQTNQNLGTLTQSNVEADRVTVTGHGATFMNYSHYFGNFGGGNAGAPGSVSGMSAGAGMGGGFNLANRGGGTAPASRGSGAASAPRGGMRR